MAEWARGCSRCKRRGTIYVWKKDRTKEGRRCPTCAGSGMVWVKMTRWQQLARWFRMKFNRQGPKGLRGLKEKDVQHLN